MMFPKFRYVLWPEDLGYVAQCLDVDVASDGCTVGEALANLGDALSLYCDGTTPIEFAEPTGVALGEFDWGA